MKLEVLWPPVWMRHLPSGEAMPMEQFLMAPPNPAMACPLKWAREMQLS